MKRFLSLFAAFVMMLSFTLVPAQKVLADNGDIIVQIVTDVTSDDVYSGRAFDADIILSNASGTNITNVKFDINGSKSSFINTTGDIDFGDIKEGDDESRRVKLRYRSGRDNDDKINYDIDYEYEGNGDEKSINNVEDDLVINGEEESSSSSSSNTELASKYQPIIRIVNDKIPTAKAGKDFTLNLKFKNEGRYMAKDADFILDFGGSPFTTDNLTMRQSVDKISSNKTAEVSYDFKIREDAKPGIYPVTIKYNFSNIYKDSYEGSQLVYIRVEEGYVHFEPVVKNITIDPNVIKAGEEGKITFNIQNQGISKLGEIKVSLEGLSKDAFTVNDQFTTKKIYGLQALADGKDVSFNLYADSNMKEGNYPLTVKLEYEDNNHNNQVVKKQFFVKVDDGNSDSISVENITFPKEQVVPGKSFDISFDVINSGEAKAEDLTVSINGGEEIVPKSQSTQMINELNAGEKKNLVFTLQPISTAKAKNNLIKIEIKNNKNESVKTIEQYVGVEVGKGSNVIITNLVSPNGLVSAKENFNVSIDVENQGIGTAKNVSVSINVDKDIICKSQSVVYINKLDSKEKKTIGFNLQAAELEDGKTCPIEITLNYDGNETPVKINTGVYVGKDDSSSKSKPKIIISKYKCEPSIVNAGEEFEIEITFLNTHKNKKVENIKAYLTADENVEKNEEKSGSVFSPVDSSNTFYISEIAPNQSVTKTLKLFTMPYAKAKTHSVKVNLEYEDDKGEEYKAEESIGIGVVQPSGFMTSDINVPEQAFVGQPIPISLEINNTGKVILDNFMVTVEGDFGASNSKTYIGNIEPGRTGYYDVELTPNNEGEVKGSLVFSYDEPNGKLKEVKKEVKVTAAPMPEPETDMEQANMEMEAQKGGASKKIVIILGVVIAALVVGVIVIKRRKKKKEMSIDE
jgi:hypothetical protein